MIEVAVFVLSGLVAAAIGAFVTWVTAARRMPASHRVAILGFPQSGKTTLITALFDFLLRNGAHGRSIVPRGDETIRRLNANLKQLELRRPIHPTTDQDVFAYRAEVVIGPGRSSRRYKLEIGDFPGEDTVAFSEQYGDWLHDTPYFQWAMSADAFIFVADVGETLHPSTIEQVARQKSAFRAGWQRLREHHLDGSSDLTGKSLTLAFTKADLLLPSDPDSLALAFLPSHGRTPERRSIKRDEILVAATRVRLQFADLLEYFERESRRFDVVFTSVFAILDGEERLGIPELAHRVLPRRGSLSLFLDPPSQSE